MSSLSIEGDRLYFGSYIVGRINPNVPLGVLREFEERLDGVYYSGERKEVVIDKNEFAEGVLKRIKTFAERSGGLLTVDEIEDIIAEQL